MQARDSAGFNDKQRCIMAQNPTILAEPGRVPEGLLCPHCRVDLVMTERLGVEIDYCPKCRGVWLDRGELDKIIEKTEADLQRQAAPPPPAPPQQPPGYYEERRSSGDHGGSSHGGQGSRRQGFLGRLFD